MAELKIELDRRESINARGASALTGATGLVTLALAVFAVFLGQDAVITGLAKELLAAALLLLLGGALCAVQAVKPRQIQAASIQTLNSMLANPHWHDTEVSARNQTARLNVGAIRSLREDSKVKARWLRASAVSQLVAVTALAASTAAIVFGAA